MARKKISTHLAKAGHKKKVGRRKGHGKKHSMVKA